MKRLFRVRRAWLAFALTVPALSGCDHKELKGDYTATTFTYAQAGGTAKDVLAAGGKIDLSVASDFSTGGSMVIPASVTGGAAFSVSLLGTAAQQGDIVTLSLAQDSFLRDIEFTFDGSSLSGSGTFDGVTVVVVLSK